MAKLVRGALIQHLEKLLYFDAVARAGSIHRASYELRISQPALSRSLKALEQALGVSLLNRTRTGVKMTAEGRILVDFCAHLSAKVSDTEKRLETKGVVSGVVQIGTYETLAAYMWPRFLHFFSQEMPDIQIRIISGNEKEHQNRLLSGSIDMVVDAEPALSEGLRSIVLYRDLFRFYDSPSRVTSDSASVSIICVPQARDRENISVREHLVRAGILPHQLVYEVDTFSSAKEMAKAGLGIAVLPERLAKYELSDGTLQVFNFAGLRFSGFGEHRICATIAEENRSDQKIKSVLSALKAFRY